MSTKKKLRPVMDTIHRIIHDPNLPSECFVFGYLDRFVGVIEKRVDRANWSDIAALDLKTTMAVPKHRIQYIKCNDEIVWDKRPDSRVDTFWENGGIHGVLSKQRENGVWSQDQTVATTGNAKEHATETETKHHHQKNRNTNKRKDNSSDEIRPNYFVCVRVQNAACRRSVCKTQTQLIQNALFDGATGLGEGCMPLKALHVTLTTLYCATTSDVDAAARVVAAHLMQHRSSGGIEFNGVATFRGRVLHGVPTQSSRVVLTQLSQSIEQDLNKLNRSGLVVNPTATSSVNQNHRKQPEREYTPHMTLCKLSRPMIRSGIDMLVPHWYNRSYFNATDLTATKTIYLCKMTKPTHKNGFYDVVSQGHGTVERGEESRGEEEKQEETRTITPKNLSTSSGSTPPLVIILRGVPGSGKSTTCLRALSLLQQQQPQLSHVICSADHYFERTDPSTGQVTYHWSASKIQDAHAYCQEKFEHSIKSSIQGDGGGGGGGGGGIVIVDNTNVRKWNYKYYMQRARHYKCPLLILAMETKTVPVSNSHSVPKETVARMLRQWDRDDSEIKIQSTRDDVATGLVKDAIVAALLLSTPSTPSTSLPSARSRSSLRTSSGTRSSLRQCSMEAAQASQRRHQNSGGSSMLRTPSITSTLPLSNKRQLSNEGKRLLVGVPFGGGVGGDDRNAKTKASVVYVGAFLTPKSRSNVLASVPTIHDHKINCEHVTLQFGVSEEMFAQKFLSRIGQVCVFETKMDCHNERVQAIQVHNTEQLWVPDTQHLHLTLSLAEGASASEGHDLVKMYGDSGEEEQDEGVMIETIISVVLRVKGQVVVVQDVEELNNYQLKFKKQRKTSPIVAAVASKSSSSKQKKNTVQVVSPVDTLYVFDFDQTLFNTPDKGVWETLNLTTWSRETSWPRDARSLSGDMYPYITPGPSFHALMERKEVLSSPNVCCIVLTGRPFLMKPYVMDVLEQHGIHTMFHRVICVPNNYSKTTAEFKTNLIKRLVHEYSNLKLVEMWDDDNRNLVLLQKMMQVRQQQLKNRKNERTPIRLITHLVQSGESDTHEETNMNSPQRCTFSTILSQHHLLPTSFYHKTTFDIIQTVACAWAQVLQQNNIATSSDPLRCVLPFGSISYGRKSDIDLVVVGPDHMFSSPTAFIEETCETLKTLGFLVHSNGPEGRLLMVQGRYFNIDVDVIFAPVSLNEYQALVEMKSMYTTPRQGVQYTHETQYSSEYSIWLRQAALAKTQGRTSDWSHGDTKDALSGPLRSLDIQTRLARVACTSRDFSCLITGIVAIQSSFDARGTHFLSLRTFQLVDLVLLFLEHAQGLSNVQNTFVALVHYMAKRLNRSSLGKSARFDDSNEMVERCRLAFDVVDKAFEAGKEDSTFGDVLTAVLNRTSTSRPAGTQLVRLSPVGGSEADQFYFRSTIQHVLPAAIRVLRSKGVPIFPCRESSINGTNDITFAVPRGRPIRDALRTALGEINQRHSHCIGIHVTVPKVWKGKTSAGSISLLLKQKGNASCELYLPCTLSNQDRAAVHEMVQTIGNGLSSSSKGDTPYRCVVVDRTHYSAPAVEFFKFPRTHHILNLGGTGVTRDDLIMSKEDAQGLFINKSNVSIDEKIDGANLGISIDCNWNIVFQNRGHVVHHTSHAQFKPLKKWLARHRTELCNVLIPDQHILFGEWCYAKHTVPYNQLPNTFVAFDVYDRLAQKFYSTKRRKKMLSQTTIPVIANVPLSNKDGAIRSIEELTSLCMTTKSQYYQGPVEGIYVRVDNDQWNVRRGKVVRPDFIQSINDGLHWMSKQLEPNTVLSEWYPRNGGGGGETKTTSAAAAATQYPRTPHLPFSPGGTSDDLRLLSGSSPFYQKGCVVITEKLDGGNCMITNGQVYARSHNQIATHPSFSRVKVLAHTLSLVHPSLSHLCLYGENMTAIHSIDYNGLKSFFYLFAVRNPFEQRWYSWQEVEELATLLQLSTVPVALRTNEEGLTEADMQRFMTHQAQQASLVSGRCLPEGFVVRLACSFADGCFKTSIAKYVRSNHVQTDETWRRTWKKASILQECLTR